MITVRPIGEEDILPVIGLYRAAYGDSFPFQEFYDAHWIKRGVYNDDIYWVVADDDGQVVGTAAVMLQAGEPDDLIGEFGRLVVHPDARGGGIGTRLFEHLVSAQEEHLEFAFAECRTAHRGAQKITAQLGFAVVGFEPLAYALFGGRESMVLVCRLLGHARELRRNNPRVIAPVYELGALALRNAGYEPDLLPVDAEPYPVDGECRLDDLDPREVARLLRLSRRTMLDPEVFGPMRLEYGFLKLKAHAARHLVLYRGGTPVGALGYVWDDIDAKVRVFEVRALDDEAMGTILHLAIPRIEALWRPAYIQIDVSAHSPRLQQSLDLLGFAPVAYCPSMVFAGGERLDVVKMVKLGVPLKLAGAELTDAAAEVAAVVEGRVAEQARGLVADTVVRRVGILAGLTDMQLARVRSICREVPYAAGEWVFAQDSDDQALFVVLEGAVEIRLGDGEPLAVVGPGEVFGELALVDELHRSAGAVCREASRLLVVRAGDFHHLLRRDPALGVVVLRNLVRTVAGRLRATNARVEELLGHKDRLVGGGMS